jgi:hypothetical protein
MSNKVKKMYETEQECRKALIEYAKDIRDFFINEGSIYNISVKLVHGNKICVAFNCDVNLDSNCIIDFCVMFGFEESVFTERIDEGYGKTYLYKFWKNVSSKEVI